MMESLEEQFSHTRLSEESVEKEFITLNGATNSENRELVNKNQILSFETTGCSRKRLSKVKRRNPIEKGYMKSYKNNKRKENSTSGQLKQRNSVTVKRILNKKPAFHSEHKQICSDSSPDGKLQDKSRIVDSESDETSTTSRDSPGPSTSTDACFNVYSSKDRNYVRKEKKKASYACAYCNYVSNLKMNYENHVRTHTGEKPFECQHCKTKFGAKQTLQRHILRKHAKDKPFSCTECVESFVSISELKDHRVIHSEERLYNCKECSQTFQRQKDLRAHERLHTGKRLHKCKICGKAFAFKSCLKRHKCTRGTKKKTRIKPIVVFI